MAGEERASAPEGTPAAGADDVDAARALLDRHLRSTLADPSWLRLRQRFVLPRLASFAPPVAVPPESFDLVRAAEELVSSLVGAAPGAPPRDVSFGDLLRGATQVLLLGDVGSGKTALLQATAFDYAGYCLEGNEASRADFTLCEEKRFPVYVDLREFSAETMEEHLAQLFRSYLPGDEASFSANRLLVTQPFLFLYDHLERVPAPRQLEVVSALAEFIYQQHPQHRYVIACRTHDFPLFQAWFKGAHTLTVRPLVDDDIAHLASLRLGEKRAQALLQRLNAEDGLWELARNPRILDAFCSLAADFEVAPARPAQLLEGLVRLLLEAEVPAEQAERQSPLGCYFPALSRAAYQMQRQGRERLERAAFHQLLEGVLSLWPRAPAARQVVGQLVDSGLLQCDAERTWLAFRSGLLRAFFCTCYLADELEKGRALEDLIPPSQLADWEGMLALLPGLVQPEKVLRALVDKAEDEAALRLATRCSLQFEQPYATLARLAPLSADLHLAFGRAFRRLGYPAQARLAFESALKLKPYQATVHLELAEVLREEAEQETAAQQYELAAGLGSDQVVCRVGRGLSFLARGMVDEARAELVEAEAALRRNQAHLHHLRGHLLEKEGRLAEALEEHRAATESFSCPHFLCHLAATQRRLGDVEGAQSSLQRALDDDPLAGEVWLEVGLLREARGMLVEAAEAYSQALHLQPSSSLARVHRGRLYGKLNQPVRAMADLNQALLLDPNSAPAYAELGALIQARGRLSEALDHYRKAIHCYPQEASYHQRAGWLLKLMGRPEEAETELGLALRLEPRNAEHRSRLGSTLADQGRYREALAAYAEAAGLVPDEPLYRHNMGAMYARLGQVEDAERSLLEALRLCNRLGESQPDGELPLEVAMVAAEAHSELGFLCRQQGRHEEALRHFQHAARLVPFADTYLARQAMAHRSLGQHEAAARALRQAASLAPEDASLQAELGLALREAGRIGEAVEALVLAVKLAPSEPRYQYYLGSAQLAAGQLEAAIGHLEEALRLEGDLAAACHDLGLAYVLSGQTDRGLESVQRAVDLDPDAAGFRATLGRCLAEVGQRERASEELEKAISLDPELAEGHYQMARLRCGEERFEEALAAAEKAATLDARRKEYASLAGWLRLRLGQPDGAVPWLRTAAELSPFDAEAWGKLGIALESVRDTEGAAEAYQRASDLQPSAFVLLGLGQALVGLERWQQAAAVLEGALEMAPNSALSEGYLGTALRHLGRLDEAREHLYRATAALRQQAARTTRDSQATAIAGESEGPATEDVPGWARSLWRPPALAQAEALFSIEAAMLHLGQGQMEEASSLLEHATSLRPDEATWWNLRGETYRLQGKLAEAREAFARAVDLAEDQAGYHRNLGEVAARLGKAAEAIPAYRRALAIEERPSWRLELGDELAAIGDLEAALEEQQRATHLAPDDARCYHRVGQTLMALGRWQEAMEALSRARELTAATGTWQLCCDLGRALDGLGRPEEAFQQYERALSLAPNEAMVHLAIGAAYRRRLLQRLTSEDSQVPIPASTDFRAASQHLRQALALEPGLAAAHSEMGRLLALSGNHEAALGHHSEAVSLAPHDTGYRCLAADSLLQLGQAREAVNLCQVALAQGQREPGLLLRLGLAHEALGDWPAALGAYEETALLAPAVADHHYRWGRALLRLGREQAVGELERAVHLQPDRPEWRYDLGEAYASRRRWQDALREYQTAAEAIPKRSEYRRAIALALGALKRHDEALAAAREAVRLAPNQAENHATLAALLQAQGSLPEALREYERAAKLQPQKLEYEVKRAIVMGLMGQREQAESELRRILSQEPTLALPYHELALSHERQGQATEALETARRAVELEPDSATYLCTLARLLRRDGQLEEALRHLRQAVEADPLEPLVYYELGQVMAARREDGRALAAYQRALELEPRAEFYREAATVLARRGRFTDAIASLQAALAQDPDQAEWRNQYGELLEQQGNLAQAQDEYRRAIRLEPRHPLYHRNLGVLLKKQARYDEAVESLQKALQLKPDYADAYRHLTSASASALLQRNLRSRSSG